MNTKGVIYYKLDETYKYPGDDVKKCGLTGGEIDSNMHFLRGYDIESIGMDYLTNSLILRRVNGNEISVKIYRENFIIEQLDNLIETVTENKEAILTLLEKDNDIQNSVETLNETIEEVSNVLDEHTKNEDLHVTAQQKYNWQTATNAINAFLDENAVADNVINTLVEIREYLNGEDGSVETLISNVAENSKSIEQEIIDRKSADEALRKHIDEEIGNNKEACNKYTDEECAKVDEKIVAVENTVDKNKDDVTASLNLINNQIDHITNEVEDNGELIKTNHGLINELENEVDKVNIKLTNLETTVDYKADKDWVLEKLKSDSVVAKLEQRISILEGLLANVMGIIITTENMTNYIKGDNTSVSVEQNTDDDIITIKLLNIRNTTY